MNERLIEVIRLTRAKYIENLPLRNIHSVDKMDLFLYIFLRNALLNKREGLSISFNMTINNMGVLILQANDIMEETTFAIWDTLTKGYEDDSFDFLTKYDIMSIDEIIRKYGMYQYSELLSIMTTGYGNNISPELVHIAPLPYTITEDYLTHILKVEEQNDGSEERINI